ncbi:hypothetical protein EB093_04700 [bacterium]|nr:hypothetical protein [bacterium]
MSLSINERSFGTCVYGCRKNISKPAIAYGTDASPLSDILTRLTINDVVSINQRVKTLAEKSAEYSGYVYGFQTGGYGGGIIYCPNSSGLNGANTTLSGDLIHLWGGYGGFVVNMTPEWGVGAEFGGMGGYTGKKIGDFFHEYGVGASYQMMTLRYKPVITHSWIIDTQLGAGILSGGYYSTISNEHFSGSETYRLSAFSPALSIGVNIRYRLDPLLYVGSKMGYFWGQLSHLQRGGADDGSRSIDLTGGYIGLEFGGNF